MPEVERPEFRKDAKPTERSFKGKGVGGLLHFAKPAERLLKGKGVGGFRGIVRIWEGWSERGGVATYFFWYNCFCFYKV